MTSEEKAAAIQEANRLDEVILRAQTRYQQARPRQRAAYHAQQLRAERRMDEFQPSLREKGYYLYGGYGAYAIFEMTDEQKTEYRRWKGEGVED